MTIILAIVAIAAVVAMVALGVKETEIVKELIGEKENYKQLWIEAEESKDWYFKQSGEYIQDNLNVIKEMIDGNYTVEKDVVLNSGEKATKVNVIGNSYYIRNLA